MKRVPYPIHHKLNSLRRRQLRHLHKLNRLSAHIRHLLTDGYIGDLPEFKQKQLMQRLKCLYREALAFFPSQHLRKIMGAAAIFISCLPAFDAGAQYFAPPQTNPFGLTNTYVWAFPSLVDIDADGDMDLFAGEYYGKLQFFENTGTNLSPAFAAPQANPFGLSSTYLLALPDFVDIDADGDMDLFVGEYYGAIQYFENTGTNTAPAFNLSPPNPFGLDSAYYLSAPAFVDIDADGDYDAFIGEYYGNLKYYENTGTSTAPAFAAPLTNPFGIVPVDTWAFPSFTDIDADGDYDLICGDATGGFM
ncbi:MAG: FG-GAP repeat domain-containing protein, partial [Flavobacteriales bacterium]